MDGLSGASGVLAVVSVAIQLLESINKLCNFLNSAKNASKDIETAIEELNLLRMILDEILKYEDKFGTSSMIELALGQCLLHLKSLHSIANTLAPGLTSKSSIRKAWTAIDTVRQSERITQFKAKLTEAKLTLILAQQGTLASSFRSNSRTQQEILEILRDKVHDSNQAGANPDSIINAPFCQIEQYSNFALETTQLNELKPLGIEEFGSTISNTIVAGQQDVQQFLGSGNKISLNRVTQSKHWFFSKRYSMFPTWLGNLECSTRMKYKLASHINRSEDEPDDHFDEQLDECSVRYKPAGWMVSCGMNSVWHIDMLKLCATGWQRCLQIFTLMPDDSLIFEFCRQGNLDAVKHLISQGQGSIWDVNSFGETPLHLAANACCYELSAFLLGLGASRKAVSVSTPFTRACFPSYYVKDAFNLVTYQFSQEKPRNDILSTLRVFISTGEDVEEALQTNPLAMESLFYQRSEPLLLDYVLSTLGADTFNDEWWAELLCKLAVPLILPVYTTILAFCSQKAVGSVLLRKFEIDDDCIPRNEELQGLKTLIEKAGGLAFTCGNLFGALKSPIELASRNSYRFGRFQYILDHLGINRIDAIPPDAEIQDRGWTREKLSLLLDYPAPTILSTVYWPLQFDCKKCDYTMYPRGTSRFTQDTPWLQKVQRIKDGLDPDGPLSEKERLEQEEFEGYLEAEEEGICQVCHKKELEEKKQEQEQEEAYSLGLNHFST